MELLKLQSPFPAKDIEWRVGRCGKNANGLWATCLAYLTNRAIMQRLDEVCGPENWKNEFTAGPAGGILCGISIKIEKPGHGDEWVTKWDGAENTDIESVKGGLSDAMKRAAVQWGIGRYLYDLEEGFATVSTEKKPGARYGQTKEKDSFYWIPPTLPAWALPRNVPAASSPTTTTAPTRKESDKCSSGDVVRISNLAKETKSDLAKVYEYFGVKGAPTKDQATKIIAALEKKLSVQVDSAS